MDITQREPCMAVQIPFDVRTRVAGDDIDTDNALVRRIDQKRAKAAPDAKVRQIRMGKIHGQRYDITVLCDLRTRGETFRREEIRDHTVLSPICPHPLMVTILCSDESRR